MGFEGGQFGNVSKQTGVSEDFLGAVNPVGGLFSEGTKGDTTTQKSDISSGSTAGIRLGKASELEKTAGGDISQQYSTLRDWLSQGPGLADIQASDQSQRSFIDMLRSINSNGGLPTAEDRRQANIFADDLFRPQQEALNQSFTQQNEQAARLAAQLNRPINDPIIQSKLRQEQMRQSAMLSADRTAFTANEARNSPFRRLELQGQLADAQGALASQAMANRMQLLNLGNQLQSQERNWRLQTGERYGTSTQSGTTTQHSGGGMMGGIGAITGFASGIMNIANSGVSAFQGGSGQSTGAYADRGQQSMTPMNYAPASPYSNGGPSYSAPAYSPSPARSSRLSSGSGGGGGMTKAAPYFLGGSSGAPIGAFSMFSDRTVKTNIKEISKEEIQELRATLKPYTFNYVNADYGTGDWVGVMAQDLVKSKLGRTVVTVVNGKLAIDQTKLNSLLLATLAEG